MKKILVLLILICGQLVALDKDSTLKIYHHIFAALSSKASISVYTDDAEYRRIFSTSKRMALASKPEAADIALITNETLLKRILKSRNVIYGMQANTVLFVTDYHLLKKSEDIVGAFYWRKGRSQLLFIKKRLDKMHIVLPSEYRQYTVDNL